MFILHRKNIYSTFRRWSTDEDKKVAMSLEVPGFEPGTFRMRSGRSTTELHPHQCTQLPFCPYNNNDHLCSTDIIINISRLLSLVST